MAERRFSFWAGAFYPPIPRPRTEEVHPSILDDAMFRHPTPPLDRSRQAIDLTRETDQDDSDSIPGLLNVSDSENDEDDQYLSDTDGDDSDDSDEMDVDGEVSDDDDEVNMMAELAASSARRRNLHTTSPASILSSRNTEEDEDPVLQIGQRYFSPSPSSAASDVSRSGSDFLREEVRRLENRLQLSQVHLMHMRRRGHQEDSEDAVSSASSSPRFVHSGIQLLIDRNAYSAEEFFSDSGDDDSNASTDSDHSFLARTNTEPTTPWSAYPSHNETMDALFSTRTPLHGRLDRARADPSSSSSASVASVSTPAPAPFASDVKPTSPNAATSAGAAGDGKENAGELDLTGRGGWSGATGYTCPLCLEPEGELSSIKCGHVFCTMYVFFIFFAETTLLTKKKLGAFRERWNISNNVHYVGNLHGNDISAASSSLPSNHDWTSISLAIQGSVFSSYILFQHNYPHTLS